MLQETSSCEDASPDESYIETDAEYLRSIMATSSKLPAMVISADFSTIYDRVLDDRTIATLTDSASSSLGVTVEQCRLRVKALSPYSGKRLICVLIHLPGVFYTVEIDPSVSEVIHWEYHAT